MRKRTKTGIDMLDNLSDEEYKLAKENARKQWDSLAKEERVEILSYQAAVARRKMLEFGGLISQRDALAKYYNDDFPKQMEQAANLMEQNGFLSAARETRKRVSGDATNTTATVTFDTPHLNAMLKD